MPNNHHAPRHAQLFELLRQQNLSELTSVRLRRDRIRKGNGSGALSAGESAMLQRLAAKSWSEPAQVRETV